jgi:hypothetical protein
MNSVKYAATQWDGTVFVPNGYLPFFTWSSGCDTLMSNSEPIYFFDKSLGSGVYGQTRSWGDRWGGGWGECGPGANFCVYVDVVYIYVNPNELDPGDLLTRQTVTHELGHAVGLGHTDSSCDAYDSIMSYDCVFNEDRSKPGPHDVTDIENHYWW